MIDMNVEKLKAKSASTTHSLSRALMQTSWVTSLVSRLVSAGVLALGVTIFALMATTQVHAEVNCAGLSSEDEFTVYDTPVNSINAFPANRRCVGVTGIARSANGIEINTTILPNGNVGLTGAIGTAQVIWRNPSQGSGVSFHSASCVSNTPAVLGQPAPCFDQNYCRSGFFCEWEADLRDGAKLFVGTVNGLIVAPRVTGGLFDFPTATPITFALAHENNIANPGSTATITYTITNPNTDDRMGANAITFDHDLAAFAAGVTIAQLPAGNFCDAGSNAEIQLAFSPTFVRFANIQVSHGQSCTFDVSYTIPAGFAANDLRQLTGALSATFPNGVAVTPAAEQTITIDGTPPTVAEVTPVATPGNDTTPNATITTDEAGTLTVGGSCGSGDEGLISAGNKVITLTQADNTTPLTAGTFNDCTVTVTDSAGNVSNELTLTNFEIDIAAPILAEVTPATTPGNDSTPSITISISEAGTLAVDGSCGSSAEGAIGSGNQTTTLTQTDNSTPLAGNTYSDCKITVTDAAGNSSTPLTLTDFTVDLSRPTVIFNSSAASTTSLASIPVSVFFSEPVRDFSEADLAVSGARVESFVSDDTANEFSSSYRFTLRPITAGSGNITVDIASNVAMDAAGNGNLATSQLGIFFDGTPSLIIRNQGLANAPFFVSFSFTEPVMEFEVSDILLTNGIASNFNKVSASEYRALITPIVPLKQVIIEVPMNAAYDVDGIGNIAANRKVLGAFPFGAILPLFD